MDCDLCDFFDCFERLFLFVLRTPPVFGGCCSATKLRIQFGFSILLAKLLGLRIFSNKILYSFSTGGFLVFIVLFVFASLVCRVALGSDKGPFLDTGFFLLVNILLKRFKKDDPFFRGFPISTKAST